VIYSVLLVSASTLPWVIGFAGAAYAATTTVLDAIFIVLACRLGRSPRDDRSAAHRLFAFSITYLFVLFATLLVDHRGVSWSSTLGLRGATGMEDFVHGDFPSATSLPNLSEA
jgi:heme o synthase